MENKSILAILFASIVFLSFNSNEFKNPPGTIKCGTIWIDKYEVTISDWKEFVEVLKNDNSVSPEFMNSILPDTILNKFHTGCITKEESVTPIKGITSFQAKEYCNWRSTVVTFRINFPELAPKCVKGTCFRRLNYNEMLIKNETASKKVKYRLPTKEELTLENKKIRRRDKSLQTITEGMMIDEEILGLRCIAEIITK
jgi:hypothetical protein